MTDLAAPEAVESDTLLSHSLLDDLEAGRIRAAEPNATVPGGWRVRTDVKAAILGLFRDRTAGDRKSVV